MDPQVRRALDAVVASGLRPVFLGLAIAYGAYAAVLGTLAPGHPRGGVIALAAATTLVFLALFHALRRKRLPPHLAHPMATAAAGLVLANDVLHMISDTHREHGTVLFVLLVVAAGGLFLSWRWLALVLVSAAASWIGLILAFSAADVAEFATVFAVALGLAIAIHAVRLRTLVGLERTRRYYTGLFESGLDLIIALDAEAVVQYVSPSAERILGWTPAEVVGTSGLDLVHPEDLPEAAGMLAEFGRLPGPMPSIEVRVRHRDGSWRDIEAVANNLLDEPAVAGIVVNARDVTDRKRAETALREAQVRYRTLVEQIPAATHISGLDETASTIFMSPQIEPMLGYAPEEWVADDELWVKLLHPEDRERALAINHHHVTTHEPMSAEYRMVARDGRVVWIRDETVVIRDEEGRPLHGQGILLDVTERKRAEAELGESHRRLAEAQRIAQVGSWELDLVTGTVSWSEEMARLHFVAPGEFGGSFEEGMSRIHPDDRPLLEEALRRDLAEKQVTPTEYRVVGPDGTVRVVYGEGVIQLDERGEPVRLIGTVQDITERKRAEEALRQSETGLRRSLDILRRTERERREILAQLMGAVEMDRGRLAEGIEDEHIQQMTAVGMRLETLRRRLSDPEQLKALDVLGRSVQDEVARLRGLLLELRPRALELDGLAAALREYLQQTSATGGLECLLNDHLSVEPPLGVRTVAFRIAQEAVANALEHAGAAHLDVLLEDRGSGFLVRVTDDGVGFDPVALEADPTVEHPGLLSMRERAELSGGWLRVRSAPFAGTGVEFWLPLGNEEPGNRSADAGEPGTQQSPSRARARDGSVRPADGTSARDGRSGW